MTPQQEQTVAGITHQLAHSLRLSTPSLASPGRAAHSPSASTLGPLARASQFHTNNVGAPTTSPATSAAAAPVHVASDSASSALAAPATTSSSSAKAGNGAADVRPQVTDINQAQFLPVCKLIGTFFVVVIHLQ